MKVRAQIGMVLNLDKCIGCHTCSVTCKNVWTSRDGVEYAWFNNVETKPGIGYPKQWENQKKWNGGWVRTSSGKLEPRQGGKLRILANLFANPNLPSIDDYYEPFTYDYQHLQSAPRMKTPPTARPVSVLTGEKMDKIEWGPNWEDDLAGEFSKRSQDHLFEGVQKQMYSTFENTFMMYLPRLCEHCLNPTCVSACPSGAMYKRTEDGIVLVDQNQCRGWRMCVSACPYKKVYFNHNTGKAEKCTLCYPRLEVGQPTICSETCVGRLRYLGVLLYDADRVTWAASQEDERDLYRAQREILLDPNDPQVVAQAQANGVPHSWIKAAQESPIWKLITEYEVALPLHPEFRTLPMVWYVPPLSPVVDQVTASGSDGEDHKVLLSAISQMRIPLEYLAGLFTAGDTAPVELALRRLAAMRSYMRDVFVDNPTNEDIPASVGMTPEKVKEMYRLLSIAKYDDRFVIPTAHPEMPRGIKELEGCPVSYDVEAFHGLAPATSNRPMGGSSPEGRQMLPLEVVR